MSALANPNPIKANSTQLHMYRGDFPRNDRKITAPHRTFPGADTTALLHAAELARCTRDPNPFALYFSRFFHISPVSVKFE
jgi:hypothetical protein